MENNSVPKPPATATKYMYIYTYTNINKSYPQAEGASIMRYPVDRTCCMQHAIHPEVITTPPPAIPTPGCSVEKLGITANPRGSPASGNAGEGFTWGMGGRGTGGTGDRGLQDGDE